MEYKDLMIDIETFNNESNAAIIQIGGIFFNRETGELGERFQYNVNLQSSINLGGTVGGETVKWWLQQNRDVLNDIFNNTISVRDALENFSMKYTERTIFWSHATFDFPILQKYLKKLGLPLMNFRNARDIRTLTDLSGLDINDFPYDEDKAHDAMYDCERQIDYCVAMMKSLKGNE